MAAPGCALGAPLRTFRLLLRELRHASGGSGRPYRDAPAYRHIVAAFRAHRVTGGLPAPPAALRFPSASRAGGERRGRPVGRAG